MSGEAKRASKKRINSGTHRAENLSIYAIKPIIHMRRNKTMIMHGWKHWAFCFCCWLFLCCLVVGDCFFCSLYLRLHLFPYFVSLLPLTLSLITPPPPSFLYFPFNFNVILLCWPYWIVQHSAYDCNVVYFSISLILHNFTMIRRKHKCDVCRFPRIFHKLICT